MRYYSLKNILKTQSHYNIIIGERSNGKTYSLLMKMLKDYVSESKEFAYIRRWAEDIRGARGSQLFANLIHNGEIEKITKGEYTGVYYYTRKYYLCNYDTETGKAIYDNNKPIGYAFALTDTEHNKSVSYPNIYNICFDEFLTKTVYLNDEFMLFMNTISTIIRKRENVQIFMLANTVNRYAPYFKEMGLDKVAEQKQGTIDVYQYGESNLKVSVEYCSPMKKSKHNKNDYYFAFNNPKLNMITNGAWELDIFPHLNIKYTPKDIMFIYFIIFEGVIYQCEIVSKENHIFTFIHEKTTPIKHPKTDLIYTLEYSTQMNYNRSIYKPTNKTQDRILWFFKTDNVCYSDNYVGNAIQNYLKTCKGV